ncbi:MAG: SDR family oxidoreductase [Minwuiales bacterium]|nr:SDR family oxidoreductase [Minwuiales bacterium]
MKLVVFGSTGSVGQHLVAQALEQGHAVTAFTRSPEKVGQAHENLRIVEGDVRDPAAVKRAIEGQDAVFCSLGMPLMNKEKLRAAGTKNIVRAMEETGVTRLVCLSALGTGDSREVLPLHYKVFIVPLFMRHLYEDHELQETHVKTSGLDWSIVRPGNFTKGERTGSYRHGFTAADKATKLKVSCADVADFMMRQLFDDSYLRRSPGLSY